MKYIGYYIVDDKNQVWEVFDYIANARKFLKNIPKQYEGMKLHLEKRSYDEYEK